MTIELDIIRLGAQGDGIAEDGNGPRYVPFALPGERVRWSGERAPEVVSRTHPERVTPICRHFGTCGGCVAQHMSGHLYAEWKRGIVVDALRQHGLHVDVAPLQGIPTESRRRAVLTARIEKGGSARLGYHRSKSAELVDIEECPILVPEIVAALPALRAVAEVLSARESRFTVLLSRSGLDIAIDCGSSRLDPRRLAALADLATEHRIARIAVGGETVVERAAPSLSFGGVDGALPPGAFVQAAAPAEDEIRRLVIGAVGKAKRVADLFCGVGTWTFPLARQARVLAVDGDKSAVEALAASARKAQGLKPIETRLRDLFREPLSPQELKDFDAVVFDPPRAGAKAQSVRLAQSTVPTIVAISCDPGTLARDLRSLVDGGYGIETVTPIDQFLFSAHVETVSVLRKHRAPGRRSSLT